MFLQRCWLQGMGGEPIKEVGEKGARLRTWHEGRGSLRGDFWAVRDPLIINQIPFKKRQRIIED